MVPDQVRPKEKGIFTEAELKALFAPENWKNPIYRVAALGQRRCEMRVGQVTALSWVQVQDTGWVKVDRAMDRSVI